MTTSAPLPERIRDHLARFDRREHRDSALRRAAVAVVIVDAEAGPAFLLTLRAATLKRHRGQYALPGGRVDAGETTRAAALRELREELGVELAEPAILGALDDYPTRSGFVITPFVMWGGPAPAIAPAPAEVAECFQIPIAELAGDDVPRFRSIAQTERPIIYYPLVGTNVHAPTAAILYQLYEVAICGRDTRVAHYDQPVFAWR